MVHHTINPVTMRKSHIVTHLMADHQKNDQACGNAQAQTSHINERIRLVSGETAPGDSEIVLEHNRGDCTFPCQLPCHVEKALNTSKSKLIRELFVQKWHKTSGFGQGELFTD